MKGKFLTALMICSVIFCSFNTAFADTVEDVTAPVIEEVLLSENSIYQGSDIKVSLNITDESEISNIIVRYMIPTGGNKDVKGFVFNEETEKYEAMIGLTEESQLGNWKVYGIMTQDVNGNFTWTMNSNSYTGTAYPVMDFSNLDFEIIEAPSDKVPPVINVESLEVSVEELYQGEKFKVSLEVSDEAGIKDIIVRYKMPVGGTQDVTGFVFNEETGKFEAEHVLSEEATPGVWQVYGIMAQDNMDNHTWIMNSNVYEEDIYEEVDMSHANINVIEVWKDVFPPVIKNVTISKTRAARENVVIISVEIEEDTALKDLILRFNTADGKRVDVKEFIFDEENGLYEALYQIPADAALGIWKVYGIMAQDTLDNFNWTMNSNLYSGTAYPVMDFSATDMNVVEPVHVDTVNVNISDVTLKVDESSEFEVTYSPEDVTDDIVIKYISSNEAVAKVEGNKIIAIAEGEATITVDVNGVQTEIKVKVEPKDVIPEVPEVPEVPEEPEQPEEPNKKYHCLDVNKDGRVNCLDLYLIAKCIYKYLCR